MILDGKKISNEIKDEIRIKIESIKKEKGIVPGLGVIRVGNEESSKVYSNSVIKNSEKLGVRGLDISFPEDVTEEELLNKIEDLNNNKQVNGIIIKLPLPKHIDERKVLDKLAIEKDVDGFKYENIGMLHFGDKKALCPCTAEAVVEILKRYEIELSGKDIVVIGRSNIVGKPVAGLLINENATVTVCHSKTKNLSEKTKRADIVIAAVGKSNFLTGDMVKDGAIVIDVGINSLDGKLVGDVNFESVKEKASFITPVPGGVGPVTVSILFRNVLKSFINNIIE